MDPGQRSPRPGSGLTTDHTHDQQCRRLSPGTLPALSVLKGVLAMADVVKPTPMLSNDDFKSIESIDDALELLRQTHGEAALQTAADALGDGFALTKNKDQFIGVPMVFVHWSISPGDFADPETGEVGNFVAARVVTKGGKFIITDGSTGISAQLEKFTADTGKTFLIAQKGLRKSEYKKEDGARADGTTYYIDTSALD
jgi:hypothetical protein